MKYKASFTVVYSSKTGKILREIWEPLRRLCWPLSWRKLPGEPKFDSWEELSDWFDKFYEGVKLDYDHYGKSRKCED